MTWETDQADGWGSGTEQGSVPVATDKWGKAAPDDWGTGAGSGWAQNPQPIAPSLDSSEGLLESNGPLAGHDSRSPWSGMERPEENTGWLNSTISPLKEDLPWMDSVDSAREKVFQHKEDLEDAWIDDEPTSEELENEHRTHSASSDGSAGFPVLVLLLLAFGLALGWLWFHPMTTVSAGEKEKLETQTSAAAAALDLGRRMVLGAKQSRQAKDFEMAAAQLKAAVTKLTDAKAPASEIREAQGLYAQSLFADRNFKEARDVWKELSLENVSGRQQAQENVRLAERELRKLANKDLRAAQSALKGGRYREAEASAQAALQSYERYGGDRAHRGMANGALGYAELKRGLREPALRHLTAANSYYPEGGYKEALWNLGASDSVSVSPLPSPPPQVSQPQGLDSLEPNYPQGASPGVHQPAPQTGPSTTVSSQPQPARPQNTFKPPPPKPKPARPNDTFVNFKDRSRK